VQELLFGINNRERKRNERMRKAEVESFPMFRQT
jgi:hypothetical protein